MEVVKMNENLKNKDGEVGYTYIRKKNIQQGEHF